MRKANLDSEKDKVAETIIDTNRSASEPCQNTTDSCSVDKKKSLLSDISAHGTSVTNDSTPYKNTDLFTSTTPEVHITQNLTTSEKSEDQPSPQSRSL